MFVGHYAAALAARAIEPKAPLWTCVAACQLVDIGWSALIIAGVEKVRFDPSLPGSPLDLYHMPWTHSLPAAALWSLAGLLLARGLLKLSWRASAVIGLAVFSHWLLDFLVHRPDLALWLNGPKVGLGWWNWPIPEKMLEMVLIAVAGGAWMWRRGTEGRGWSAGLVFLALLGGLAIVAEVTAAPTSVAAFGVMTLAIYLAVTAVAWLVERKPSPSPSSS